MAGILEADWLKVGFFWMALGFVAIASPRRSIFATGAHLLFYVTVAIHVIEDLLQFESQRPCWAGTAAMVLADSFCSAGSRFEDADLFLTLNVPGRRAFKAEPATTRLTRR